MQNVKKLFFSLALISFCLCLTFSAQAQEKESGYKFKDVVRLKTTSVKDQNRSGTCWVFSGLSFVESELIRMGKGEHDLSEMFLVWGAYHTKAIDYVRFHGKLAFGQGGESNDVMDMIKAYGIVPESNYTGLNYGTEGHTHGEVDGILKGMLDAVIKNKNRRLSKSWLPAIDAVLNTYLGEMPEKFNYNGKEYSPKEFQNTMGFNPDDYVEIGSFTHHPFYSKFVMEVPDNWSQGEIYNVPLDEFIETCDNALNNGYSLLWGSDVSEKGFSHRNGVAIIPEKNTKEMSDSEISKWQDMSAKEKRKALYSFDKPISEKKITQEIRQEGFDNFQTQDDHGMHIVGIAKDQTGKKYYIVKNSWAESNLYKGYFYASEAFVRAKSMTIMIHKDAVPKKIAKKLNL